MGAMHFTCLCFLSLQPKGFRRYYSSPLLIHEQFGCIKEVMPIGRFWLLFRSSLPWAVLCSSSSRLPAMVFALSSLPAPFGDWMSFCHLRKGPLQRYKAGRGEGVFTVRFAQPPHTYNLLAIALFRIITNWDQGRNLKGRMHWWRPELGRTR